MLQFPESDRSVPRAPNYHRSFQNRRRFNIISKVLTWKSQSLLTDHIDILEEYMNLRQIQEPSSLSAPLWNTTALTIGSASLVGLAIQSSGNTKLAGVGIATGLSLAVLAGSKWAGIYQEWQDLNRLSDLLDALNQYRCILKRNLTYLTDSSHLNGILSDRDSLMATSATESAFDVIQLLHQFVVELDDRNSLVHELPGYEPFEELGDCESLLDPDNRLKNFKSLYSVFLFIQSQFVLRVTIALSEKDDRVKTDLKWIENQLNIQVGRKDLEIHVRKEIKGTAVNSIKTAALTWKEGSASGLKQLKWTSTNLLTKLMVQLNQFDQFNDKLRVINDDASPAAVRNKMLAMNEHLSTMESVFVSCACEFENVQLLMRKMLNIENETKRVITQNEDPTDNSQLDLKVVDQSTAIDIDDEFFILDGQMAERDSNGFDASLDDGGLGERVLKTSFKPVLKQLRKQIDPLNSEMLERERKFLQQQGVEVPVVIKELAVTALSSSSTESDEELDENMVLRKKRFAAKPSKYDENRQFLEEKVQMGIFRLPPPLNRSTAEDVLE